MVTRGQLSELGFTAQAITHRVRTGRLHRKYRGVYAVGGPDLDQLGEWMAAVLACGPDACLSHDDAGALLGLIKATSGDIHVIVPRVGVRQQPGIVLHRGARAVIHYRGIPVTSPIETLVDLASRFGADRLEAAVNEADIRRLCTPEEVRATLGHMPRGRKGVAALKTLLDRRTFRLTRSRLERLFLPIAESVGLPRPLTRQIVNGFEVDFYWPELGLVVETDSLRYHRTAQQQAKDLLRDQAHTAAGLTCLRFSHYQVAYEEAYVAATLAGVARRLRFAA